MRSSQYSRLSSSCPSLAVDPGSDPDLLSSVNSSPIQAPNLAFISSHMSAAFNDLIHRKGLYSVIVEHCYRMFKVLAGSLSKFMWPSISVCLSGSASKEWLWRGGGFEVSRRRSWTALEDLTNGKMKRKSTRQRRLCIVLTTFKINWKMVVKKFSMSM